MIHKPHVDWNWSTVSWPGRKPHCIHILYLFVYYSPTLLVTKSSQSFASKVWLSHVMCDQHVNVICNKKMQKRGNPPNTGPNFTGEAAAHSSYISAWFGIRLQNRAYSQRSCSSFLLLKHLQFPVGIECLHAVVQFISSNFIAGVRLFSRFCWKSISVTMPNNPKQNCVTAEAVSLGVLG